MSLYEIMSMNAALENMDKNTSEAPMTDEEFEALKDAVRAMDLPDVRLD